MEPNTIYKAFGLIYLVGLLAGIAVAFFQSKTKKETAMYGLIWFIHLWRFCVRSWRRLM